MVVLTHSAPRLHSLRAVAREEAPKDQWPCNVFATFHALEPTMFARRNWLSLEDKAEPERHLCDAAYGNA